MQTNSYQSARSLRNLYFIRTAFQLVWAAGVLSTAVTQPTVAAMLLVVYPLWDVACTVYDLKALSPAGSARTSQFINAILGTATALGIAVTVLRQPAYAIAIFGAWALGAGLLQLIAGLIRRKLLGGQWAMILSGTQSAAAGIAFVLGGLSGKFHTKDMGGYAIFGAIYFFVAGVLLKRRLSEVSSHEEGRSVAL